MFLKEENKGILADTSVWIEFFKSESKIGDKLETLISKNSVYTCGIVVLELTQGVNSEKEKNKIMNMFSALEFIEMTKQLWMKAGELSAALRKKGKIIPLSDILIAVIAIQYNLEIFTIDKHFKEIPGIDFYN